MRTISTAILRLIICTIGVITVTWVDLRLSFAHSPYATRYQSDRSDRLEKGCTPSAPDPYCVSVGDIVTFWQQIVRADNDFPRQTPFLTCDIDGIFGVFTSEKTRGWQRDEGLYDDGATGQITWTRALTHIVYYGDDFGGRLYYYDGTHYDFLLRKTDSDLYVERYWGLQQSMAQPATGFYATDHPDRTVPRVRCPGSK